MPLTHTLPTQLHAPAAPRRRRCRQLAALPAASAAPPPPPVTPGRRAACARLALAAAAALVPQLLLQRACAADATSSQQLGVVGGTLATCEGALGACLSTFDDRPAHFAAPWEFDGTPAEALAALLAALPLEGAAVTAATPGYVRAAFVSSAPGSAPDLDVEFLFQTEGDATVALRAQARPAPPGALPRPDLGRSAERLFKLRRRLQWDEVFVLRNRGNALLETPLDGFGPVPPAGGADYRALDDPLAT